MDKLHPRPASRQVPPPPSTGDDARLVYPPRALRHVSAQTRPDGTAFPYATPPTRISGALDDVTTLVQALNSHARMLGETYGVASARYQFPDDRKKPDVSNSWDAVLMAMEKMATTREYVMLMNWNAWGVFWIEEQPFMTSKKDQVVLPITSAPMDARRKFLRYSDDFFGKYFSLVDSTLEGVRDDTSKGQATLTKLLGLIHWSNQTEAR